MRKLIPLLLTLALAACAAPVANTPTAAPSAEVPGNSTAAPPTAAPSAEVPGNSTAAPPTIAPPTAAPTTAPTEAPQPTASPAGEPSAVIGYGQARAAAFLPADQALAVATEAGLLTLELPGLEPRSFTPIPGGANDIVISPDGATIALAQNRGPGGAAVLVGPPGGPFERELPGYGPVFSPDGARLAVSEYDMASGDTTTRLYNLGDGAELVRLVGQGARFSPDGQLVGTTYNAEALVSQSDGTTLLRVPGFDVAFSPDGALLAIAGETGAAVYPIREGAVDLESLLLNAPGWARMVDFGEDGRLYVVSGTDLQMWDVASQREIGPRTPVEDMVTVGPGGLMAASQSIGGDGPTGLTILRLADGQEIYDDSPPLGGLPSFSSDGGVAAVVDLTGDVALFSVEQGELARRNLSGYDRAALDAAGGELALGRGLVAELHPLGGAGPRLRLGEFRLYDGLRELSFDGGRLVAELNRFSLGSGVDRFFTLAWDVATGSGGGVLREQGPLAEGAYGFSEMAQPVVWDFDPASGRMAWRDADGTVYLDDGTPEGAAAVAGAPADVRSIALAPGGGRLAMGDAAGELFIVDTASRGPLMRGPAGEGVAIVGLAWSGDGAWLALRLESGDLLLQEAVDDDPPLRISGAPADINLPGGGPLALSADGSTLAAGGYEGAAVYSRDGAELLRVAGETEALALSADGATLVAIQDGRALVYPVSP